MGKAYGLNTQVLLANLQHFCNNNIIILNYYFIPGLFPSHSWWAESCSVRLSRVDGVQPATSELPGCPSTWTTGPMDRGTTWTDDGMDGWLKHLGGILGGTHQCIRHEVHTRRRKREQENNTLNLGNLSKCFMTTHIANLTFWTVRE